MITIDGELSTAQEYAGTQTAMDTAITHALDDGLTVVRGESDTLLLDLDDGAEVNLDVYKLVSETFGPVATESWISRNGSGRHVVLRFAKARFTPAEALALEGALGSDPRRVVFGIMRLLSGVVQPRMLFRPADLAVAATEAF